MRLLRFLLSLLRVRRLRGRKRVRRRVTITLPLG